MRLPLLREAARDVRYLAERGFPGDSAIRFVSDHYRLPVEDRFILARAVQPGWVSRSRQAKITGLDGLKGKRLAVDGYNVLITTESLLGKCPVFICDDGFLRDVRGVFKSYHSTPVTARALKEILDLLREGGPSSFTIVLDQQISHSGLLAGRMRRLISRAGLCGTAATCPAADWWLKHFEGVVATGDGSVIDAASEVVDLAAEVARRQNIVLSSLQKSPLDG
ncbi:MAG: hypothetical protein A4E45_00882 [Methanosaeta sp. PtaB.Bin039]|nr:MAG: hypothetical protein A4E45_00882 [Methanosaeta sp. PtaB.Bin039]OPY45268.1 MAG: hypothetical protein A4E47_01046 [Methanosaeta sp. PtaU1.Bin028]HOT07628.1 DUF434 domain-containing protein [Methanotrichaceae archaeon]HQF15676.1 DUF434 domain-containing protein [Methanotrichaceae archaeon]HQI90412.1 DUF434 domain-containing protein [Methanotrichaceae archaeon]